MSHCHRCGATNESTSRFCVACGTPLAVAAQPPVPIPGTAPPPAMAGAAPSWGQPGQGAPFPPAQVPAAPPSAGFPYAPTASPPTREEFEAQRAAAQAAAAVMRAKSNPPPPGGAGLAPPPGALSAPPAPVVAYGSAPAPGQTAGMPGVAQDPEAVPEGAPRLLAGFLVSYDTHPLGRFWPIYQGRTRVGRQGSGAELDLELDHPTASSRHASFLAAACPGRIKIEDTGSTNGTFLNGARLVPGARHELRDGDRIRFGLLSTIVKIV